MINYLLDFIFPKKCEICGKVGTFFCKKCFEKMKFGKKVFDDFKGLEKVFSIFEYSTNFGVKKLIKSIKFHLKFQKSEALKEIYLKEFEKNFKNFEKIVLVPIPLHFFRKLFRGFNQAEILADFIFKQFPEKTRKVDLLKRKKYTKFQNKLNRNERKENLKNAFFCKTFDIKKEEIIVLIDDISTTGFTLEEAGKEVSRNFKNKIFGFLIASDKK